MNSSKWIDRLFAVSLVLIGTTSLIFAVTGLTGIALPDWALRAIGVVNLISLPVLVYSTIKSFREKAGMRAAAKSGKKNAGKKKKGKKK